MTPETLFETWAPTGSRWSAWAKPVLFSCLPATTLPEPPPALLESERALAEIPTAANDLALVVDLPGAEGVFAALALARRGYRPVPLYNTVPLPSDESTTAHSPVALVDTLPILAALASLAPAVAACPLPDDAPPVFLLDAHRRTGSRPATPTAFDNRSICFTTDFPSANFLLAQSLRRVWLIQSEATPPQADLANTLRAWQAAGLGLWTKPVSPAAPAMPLIVQAPSLLRAVGHQLLELVGLRREPLGSYEGVLTAPVAHHTNRRQQQQQSSG